MMNDHLSLVDSTGSKSPSQTHIKIAEETINVRNAASNLSRMRLEWKTPAEWPTKFLIVSKEHDQELLVPIIAQLASWLIYESPLGKIKEGVFLHVGPHLACLISKDNVLNELYRSKRLLFWSDEIQTDNIDLILTLGGDGTVLNAAWLFQGIVPPILSFHFGTLGFLTLFDFDRFQETITNILEKGTRINTRMRFECRLFKGNKECSKYQVLNELVIDRGPSPFMALIECYGDGNLLTTVQSDGLIVATPTGSTAYSMSAGGSIVHPDVPSILITPICPHTLSFRPFLLPDSMHLTLRVSPTSRSGTAWIAFDGRSRVELEINDEVRVCCSEFPVPTICDRDQTLDWFGGLTRCLHWNERGHAYVKER